MVGQAGDVNRLKQQAERREEWAAGTTSLIVAILGDTPREPVALVAQRLVALSDSVHATVVHVGADGGWEAAAGVGKSAPIVGAAQLEDAAATQRPSIFADGQASPVMLIPLSTQDAVDVIVVLSRSDGAAPFGAFDITLADDLARRASLVLQLSSARAEHARLAQLDDRVRIARDLHQVAVTRIFAAGLELYAVASLRDDAAGRQRIEGTIDLLDQAIEQIRAAVFSLSETPQSVPQRIRYRLLDLVAETGAMSSSTPTIAFLGPVDAQVRGDLADDVIAVAEWALTVGAQGADREATAVMLAAQDGQITLRITIDGHRIDGASRHRAFSDLRQRSAGAGRQMSLDSGGSGTRLVWTAPIPAVVGNL